MCVHVDRVELRIDLVALEGGDSLVCLIVDGDHDVCVCQ